MRGPTSSGSQRAWLGSTPSWPGCRPTGPPSGASAYHAPAIRTGQRHRHRCAGTSPSQAISTGARIWRGNLPAPGAYQSTYVARFLPTGNHLWSHSFAGLDLGARIVPRPNGDVVVAGTAYGSATIGAQTLTPAFDTVQVMFGEFAANGMWLGGALYGEPGGNGYNTVDALAVDALGAIVGLGAFSATMDFGFASVTTNVDSGRIIWGGCRSCVKSRCVGVFGQNRRRVRPGSHCGIETSPKCRRAASGSCSTRAAHGATTGLLTE